MEKSNWTDCVRNEKVLSTAKAERNILHTIRRRKTNWIGHILCRNCIEGKIEGRIEMTERRGGRGSSYRMVKVKFTLEEATKAKG